MPNSGNQHCAAVAQDDEYESHQRNDASEYRSEAPSVRALPSMPSSTFNPDATPFVFNPRPSALNPLAEPFNPLSSSTASSAVRPAVDLPLQQPVLSAHSQHFEPPTTVPLVEPYCPVFSFEHPALDPNCWRSPAGTHAHAYLDVGAGSSLEQLTQLAQPTEEHAELGNTNVGMLTTSYRPLSRVLASCAYSVIVLQTAEVAICHANRPCVYSSHHVGSRYPYSLLRVYSCRC